MKNIRPKCLACRISLACGCQFLIFLLAGNAAQVNGQRPRRDRPPSQPVTHQMMEAEFYRKRLHEPLLKPGDPNPDRTLVLKQVRKDFGELQELNNSLMATAWASRKLDYGYISLMVAKIRSRAVRLKSNLVFPTGQERNRRLSRSLDSVTDLRASLMILDTSINTFVKNPVFQQSGVIDVIQATKAGQDLGDVIELSGKLKKIASQLEKASMIQP